MSCTNDPAPHTTRRLPRPPGHPRARGPRRRGSFFPTSKSQPRATLHGVCAHGTDTDDLVTNWIAAARKILHRDAMLEAATRALYDADTLNDALAEACHAILRHSTEASLRMAAQSELDRLARDAAARTAA